MLVDGPFGLRAALFNYKGGLVRPSARFQKFFVRPLRNKDVREHVMTSRRRAVIHAEAGRKKYPLAIVLWTQQFSTLVVLRLVR